MKRFYQNAALVIASLFLVMPFAHAQNTISPGTVLKGFVLDKNKKKFPMVVKITSMDNADGNFTGDVSWPSLNSVHRIEGRLTANTITFKEVSYIKKGGAHLNCEYALIIDGGSLDGRWVEPGHDTGGVQLKIK